MRREMQTLWPLHSVRGSAITSGTSTSFSTPSTTQSLSKSITQSPTSSVTIGALPSTSSSNSGTDSTTATITESATPTASATISGTGTAAQLSSSFMSPPTATSTTSPIPPTPPSPRTTSSSSLKYMIDLKGIREDDNNDESFFDSPIGQGQLAHATNSSSSSTFTPHQVPPSASPPEAAESFRLGYFYSPRPLKSPISPPSSTSQLKVADTFKTLSPVNPLWSASRKSLPLPEPTPSVNVPGSMYHYPIVDEPKYSLSVKSAAALSSLTSSSSSSPLPPPANIVNPPTAEDESIRQSKRFSKTFGIELDDY
jgi:hypothetical protein